MLSWQLKLTKNNDSIFCIPKNNVSYNLILTDTLDPQVSIGLYDSIEKDTNKLFDINTIKNMQHYYFLESLIEWINNRIELLNECKG